MNTKVAYIITEGQSDAELIKLLLPDITNQPEDVGVLAAPGYSAALSIAESVLLQTERPALLVLDADTTDENRIQEKRAFIEQYVKVNGMTCQIAFAVPTLEILFFTNKEALGNALHKPIGNEVWALAMLSPKRGIELITDKSREVASRQLLKNDSFRKAIAQAPLVREIKAFIQEAQQPVSV